MKRHDLLWLIVTALGAGALMAAFAFALQNSLAGFFGFALVSITMLGLRDIVDATHKQHLRRAAMRQAAARLGFSFRETAPCNVLGWSDSFQLTRDGLKTRQAADASQSPGWASMLTPNASNVMERSIDDVALAVFDFAFEKPNQEVTTRQTVVAVRSPALQFPHCALVPTSWPDRLVHALRGKEIVHGRYRAIRQDPDATARFDERLFPLLDGSIYLEAGEGFLLLYRSDKLIAPQDVNELVRNGLEICSVLANGALDKQASSLLT